MAKRKTAGRRPKPHEPEWRLGTIGFGYADWNGVFYPAGLKSSDRLSFYARHFDAVELDTTFHAAPTHERVKRWAAAVPDDFRFCVKTPKDVTHAPPPLSRRAGPMVEFLDVVRGFGGKLGVVLLQFPPSFDTAEARDLEKFLDALPTDLRYALELRHGSWNTDATAALLRDRRCCRVTGDYFDEPWEIRVTTDFLYVRWIGEHGRFPTLDREQVDATERLEWWKDRLAKATTPEVKAVWGLVNNDYSGYAVGTANRMKRLLGLPVKQVQDPRQGELFR
jgi:uncharacterized protein YecE (DUF72 family)